MKDILNVDGTFKRYYKNNNLKEKGKYINGEYEGEVINYLTDGHISQKRYFNKGIIETIISYKKNEEFVLNNEDVLENLFILRNKGKNDKLRAFPSSIFEELNYIPTYYKNEDFVGELLLKIWGDNCLWLVFLVDSRKVVKMVVYRNKKGFYSPKKGEFDFSNKDIWDKKFKIKVLQAETKARLLKPVYVDSIEILD